MHPLDDAYLWLNRADEHFEALANVLNQFIHSEYKAMSESFRVLSTIGAPSFIIHGPTGDSPPVRASLIIGELVQALRRSLDYLVYELAILDSGSVQDGTQFPIEDSPDIFRQRCNETLKRGVYLRGLNNNHKAAIEKLQPYNGVKWTKVLAQLSNEDKHRRLRITQHDAIAVPSITKDPTKAPIIVAINSNKAGIQMYLHITPSITFDVGLSVPETIKELKTQVAQTLEDFKPEFELNRTN